MQSIKSYLLKGGSWVFIGKLILALLSIVMVALITRLLPASDVGVYFLAFNLATFLAVVARFGLENTMLKLVSDDLNQEKKFTRVIIFRCLSLALMISVSLALFYFSFIGDVISILLFDSPELKDVTLVLSVWLILLAFQFHFGEVFRAFQDIRSSVLYGGLLTACMSVFILFILSKLNEKIQLEYVLWVIVISTFLSILIASRKLIEVINSLKLITNPPGFVYSRGYVQLLRFARPLAIYSIVMFVVTNSDIWILGVFVSDEQLAIYGAAARLVLVTGMGLMIVNAIVPPLISKLNGEKDRLEDLLRVTASLAAIPSLLILVLLLFFGDNILSFLYGDFYRQGAVVLIVLTLAQIVNVCTGSCGYLLIMNGKQKVLMKITCFTAAFSVSLSIIVVEKYGIDGVACATAIGMILQQIIVLIVAKKETGIWTHAGFLVLKKTKKVLEEIS